MTIHNKNMTIHNNYMNMDDSKNIEGIPADALISGINVARDGQRRDHLIYSKSYEGLNIVGNYFEGMENGAAGGVKLRNGEDAYIGSNHFKDVPLLTYIYKDLTKDECVLHNTTIYNNVFDETDTDKKCTGILYYQDFDNGSTVTFPDGTVSSDVQGDIENFIVYKNRFLYNGDGIIDISNRAEQYKDQFYVTGNIYEKDTNRVSLNRKKLSTQDFSEDEIKGKLNEGYNKFKDVKIPLFDELKANN